MLFHQAPSHLVEAAEVEPSSQHPQEGGVAGACSVYRQEVAVVGAFVLVLEVVRRVEVVVSPSSTLVGQAMLEVCQSSPLMVFLLIWVLFSQVSVPSVLSVASV